MTEFKNAEGYADPTPYNAFCAIKKKEKTRSYKPMVYVCSPYAGDVEKNVTAARRYSRFAYKSGMIPVTPHLLYPQFMNDADQKERDDALWMGCVLLSKCNELWVFGDATAGMKREIDKAKQKNIRIRYFTEKLKEVPENVNHIG